MKYQTWHTQDLKVKIRQGNEGIGYVANISKDASTCGRLSKYCRPYCYMGSAYYQSTKNITQAHEYNTKILNEIEEKHEWSLFVFDMVRLIQKKNITLFRVDVNGDLISKGELFAWMQIAKVCKQTKFWIPTKRFYWLDAGTVFEIKGMDNLSVSLSMFFNMSDDIWDIARKIGLPIAYAGTVNKYRYKVCSKPCETCRWCYDHKKNVFLPLHGVQAKRMKKQYDAGCNVVI